MPSMLILLSSAPSLAFSVCISNPLPSIREKSSMAAFASPPPASVPGVLNAGHGSGAHGEQQAAGDNHAAHAVSLC